MLSRVIPAACLMVYFLATLRPFDNASNESHYRTGEITWTSCDATHPDALKIESTWQGRLNALVQSLGLSKDFSEHAPELLCTRVNVPLSYEKHDSRSISIPLIIRPARSHTKSKPAPLLVNPGGPGGSGVGFLYGGEGEDAIDTEAA